MATWRFVNLNIPEAHLLADLASQANDLQITADICDLALAELAKKPLVLGLLEALTSGAVVKYYRCFASGVRATFPNSVLEGLPENQNRDHEFFVALRNKYIAHSVNVFEETKIVAYLVPEESGPRSVASISLQHVSLASLGAEDFTRLKALSLELHHRISILIEEEKLKVLDAARKLPIDRLYSQIDPPKIVAVDSDVTKTRKPH